MLIISILIVAGLLVISELWWRSSKVHDELSRKFVHITVGSFVAFWPFFLSWTEIRYLSVAFLVGVVLSKYLHVFRAIHSVQRPTWGEIFFALAVGLATFITHDKWIYMTALLQMSLADGLAALAGTHYGKSNAYKIMGHTKSLVGNAVCFVTSIAILIVYHHFGAAALGWSDVLGISLLVTVLENYGIYGLDNLIIPLFVTLALTKL